MLSSSSAAARLRTLAAGAPLRASVALASLRAIVAAVPLCDFIAAARLRTRVAIAVLAVAAVSAAQAATITLGVALDTDANPATGCTIATTNGPATGVERLVTVGIVTSGAGASVDRVDIAQCSAGSMAASQPLDGGGWPVGLGNGTGGTSVIELALPLSVLPPGATMRAVVVADNGAGGTDATGAFTITLRADGGPVTSSAIPVPLAPWLVLPLGLLVFVALRWLGPRLPGHMAIVAACAILAVSGIAWAASILRDGNVGDWAGIAPAIVDPAGDAPANADLVAVFHQQDATHLYLRIDADIRRDGTGDGNVAPTVHAGGNQAITLPATATLAGSASDDGLPNPPGAVTIGWTKVSGPGTVTFASSGSAATTASFSAAGSYVLQLAAYDGALASTDQVTVAVNAGGGANAAPVVSAGADQTVTLPAGASLAGSAGDDGLPNPPGALALHWSLVSGPGSAVSFGDDSAASTTATFGGPGTYVLRLSASDGALDASADVTISVQSGAPALEAVADRTIAPGDHLQIPLVAADHGVPGGLTYVLPTAPGGASLAPPPVIDWTPSTGQLGTHTFTATVTNSAAQSASVSFHVTVVAPANHAPKLAPQASQSINAGVPFARTLTATDPDGDALTFSLVAKPAGMTLSGANIAWPTVAIAPGDYNVTARVTDTGGLHDQATFTITVRASAAPAARDDVYTVNEGDTLTVPAAGVLANDTSAIGAALSATRLTNPDKGTLSAFNADGSFTFAAPAALPPATSLQTTQLWGSALYDNTGYSFAADINHDGGADIIVESYGTPAAFDGKTGAQLWRGWDTSSGSLGEFCRMYLFATDYAMGQVDASGDITLIAGTMCDPGYTAGVSTRLIAVDTNPAHAVAGAAKVKWVSERLDEKLPAAPSVGAEPVLTYSLDTRESGLLSFATPTLARLTAGGAVKVLTRTLIGNNMFPFDKDGDSSRESHAGCAAATGNVADEETACTVTFIVDAATGVKEAALTAPNPSSWYETPTRYPFRQNPPVVADLDGDGQVEIISGGDVFKYAGGQWTLAWQATPAPGTTLWYEAVSVSVADMDGDGKAEVILQAEWDNNIGHQRGFLVYDANGTLLHVFSYPAWDAGAPTIADVDGDGVPEIVFVARGIVYAYHADGTLLWAGVIPDDDGTLPGDPSGLMYSPNAVGDRSGAGSHVQVYDLDLDGSPEVIVNATYRVAIFNGRTGMVKISTHNNALVRTNTFPMIVDADGDGHAEILSAAGNPGVCGGCVSGNIIPFAGENRDWAPAPLVFNQAAYNPWASNDTAAIKYDGGVHRSFRNQRQMGEVTDPRTRDTTKFTYAATDSAGTSAPTTVTITVAPTNRAPVITSTPPTAIAALPAPGSCATGCVYPNVIYQLAAYDPDTGDTVHYEMPVPNTPLSYPYGKIDPSTGLVTMYVGPCGGSGCDFGPTLFVVAAVDSFGARTEQSFIVDISTQLRTVPNVVGLEEDDAAAAIVAAELRAHVTEVYAASPPGIVVAQNPSAGVPNVTRTATVDISVSKGPAPVKMPFVMGQQIVAASALLGSLGIDFAVDPIASITVPAGQVMTQDPAFGTMVAPGVDGPAALGVSMGPPLVKPITSIVVEPGESSRLVNDKLAFKATAVFNDGTSADITLRAAWSSSLPSVASVDVTGVAKGLLAGDTIISAALSGKSAGSALHIKPRFTEGTLPVAAITAPADDSTVYGPADVTGTASDANFLRYELAYAPADSDNWTLLAEGASPVVAGTLGSFDPTVLLNDLYTLRLRVYDRGDNMTEASVTVQVAGQRKVGLFSISIRDFTVPLGSIPIGIERVYDSRDKRSGDFGFGWRLALDTLRVRSNRVLGTGWVRNVSGPTVSLAPTSPHKVSVTLADGRVEEFDLVVSPTSNIGSLDATHVAGFVARPGTLGTLEALANGDMLIVSDGAGDVLVDDATLEPYSPKLYRYTSAARTSFDISPDDGVHAVVDANGQSLTFDHDGITHSSGRKVIYARDADDRIVAITDPAGHVYTYAYDANGDLVTATDATRGSASYGYDRKHGLLTIVDPTDRQLVRNEYDEAGRVVAIVDANGNALTFAHDDDAQVDVITDRRGHVTRVTYDDKGNVTSRQRTVTVDGIAVAANESATFDGLGNATSATDADGRTSTATFDGARKLSAVVDAGGLALTSTFSYVGDTPNVNHAADAGGRSFDFDYDARGNVAAYATPIAGATTSVIGADGRPVSRTDALGNTVSFTYDSAGRVIGEDTRDSSNTLLRRLDRTYDDAGNVATQTLHRTDDGTPTTLTTRYAYDAANRVVAVTDAAGGVTRTEYDAAGRVTARVDALGRGTTTTHDELGRPVRIDYPDGTHELTAYDANNNVVAETDRAGRTTRYEYDELDRRVRTILADGASTHVVISAGGRLLASIDALGNRIDYGYDSAGRLTTTTLPAVKDGGVGPLVRPAISRTLNALGQAVSTTDPKGRNTTYLYDGDGRLVKTTFVDGSAINQAYDALGHRRNVVDEDGKATQFTYDGLGRIASVSGLAGSATYGYDEAGNLTRETDALGRVTRYRHDALNRLVEKQYPGGGTERFAYDAVGNLTASTDGNGRVTSYAYDAMNRLVRRTLPDGIVHSFTYMPDGQRATATTPGGTTSYTYDARGAVASITLANGDVVSRSRDANGNLVALATPSGTVTYSYDALSRLVGGATPAGNATIAYDLAGNVVQRALPDGAIAQYVRDTRDRVTALTYRSDATTIASYATEYTAAGRRSRVVENDGSDTRYTYDANGRLGTEVRTGPGARNASYAYDAVGNRTSMTVGGVTTNYSYDNDDRLLAAGAATFSYDGAGRRVGRAGPSPATFGYDGAGRLATVAIGGTAAQYGYDADGNRTLQSDAWQTTRFVVDASNPTGFAQVLEQRSAGDVTRFDYLDRVLSRGDASGSHSYVQDGRGDVRALLAGSAVTDTYRYDAWGTTLASTGATPNPYRYRGEWLDDDTGLYGLRARDYDPAVGRFLTRDPYAGTPDMPVSRHRYLYAGDDPVNASDPSGLETLAELQVTQMIESQLSLTETFGKVRAACTVKSTLDQVSELMFWGGAALQLGTSLAASSFSFDVGAPGFQSSAFALTTGIPLIAISRENAPEGTAEKIGLSLSYGGGKVGLSGSMKFSGKPSVSLGISAPPLDVKWTGSVTGGKATLAEFQQCGIKTATVELAPNFKVYSSFGAGINVGASGTLDITLNLFNGHFSTGFTLMGMDASTKGVTVYIGGVGLGL